MQLGEYKLKQNEIALHTQEMGNFLNLRKLSVGMIVEYWVLILAGTIDFTISLKNAFVLSGKVKDSPYFYNPAITVMINTT